MGIYSILIIYMKFTVTEVLAVRQMLLFALFYFFLLFVSDALNVLLFIHTFITHRYYLIYGLGIICVGAWREYTRGD